MYVKFRIVALDSGMYGVAKHNSWEANGRLFFENIRTIFTVRILNNYFTKKYTPSKSKKLQNCFADKSQFVQTFKHSCST